MRIQHQLIFAISLLGAAFAVTAQDLGRSPDGTAFRKTVDGFEVSDYIAELEVSNQELQARLQKVEAELAKMKLREKAKQQDSTVVDDDTQTEDCEQQLLKVDELSRLAQRQDQTIAEQVDSIEVLKKKIQHLENSNEKAAQSEKLNDLQDSALKPANEVAVKKQSKPAATKTSSLEELLNSIKALQLQRLKMFRQYQDLRDQKGKPDIFEPEELVARSGRSLKFLAQKASKTNSALEEQALVRDLSEIRGKLQKDIDELNKLKTMLVR